MLVLVRRRGRGRRSGLEFGQVLTKGALLFQECGDKVTRFVYYWERDRALAYLRIEE